MRTGPNGGNEMPGFLQTHNITYRRQMQACLHISIRPARRVCHPSHPRAFAARPALLPPRPALLPSAPPARLPPARRFSHPPRPALLPSVPPCCPSSPARFATQPHAACFATQTHAALLPPVPPSCPSSPTRFAAQPRPARACRPARLAVHPARRAFVAQPRPARFAAQPHAACLPSVPPDAPLPPTPTGAFVCTKKRRSKACFAPAWWRRHPESNRGMRILQTLALPLGYVAGDGAGDGARTRHLSLGKAALYQMSYSRRSAATAAGLVHPQGLEPWTPTLRVSCSTN